MRPIPRERAIAKIENGASDLGEVECRLSDKELGAVAGGVIAIITDQSEARGFVVNWAASCSNNLREAAL